MTNEGDAAARTLGLGRRAVAENRGWSRGQEPTGGRAGGEEHGLRAVVAHSGGRGGASRWAEQRGRVMLVRITGEEREGHGVAVSSGERLWRAPGELGRGGGGFARCTVADEEKRRNAKGYKRG
jgi:hypothetical protein